MITNQRGEEVEETTLFECWSTSPTNDERDMAIGLILTHLNCTIVRTNATKHGSVELELREVT